MQSEEIGMIRYPPERPRHLHKRTHTCIYIFIRHERQQQK